LKEKKAAADKAIADEEAKKQAAIAAEKAKKDAELAAVAAKERAAKEEVAAAEASRARQTAIEQQRLADEKSAREREEKFAIAKAEADRQAAEAAAGMSCCHCLVGDGVTDALKLLLPPPQPTQRLKKHKHKLPVSPSNKQKLTRLLNVPPNLNVKLLKHAWKQNVNRYVTRIIKHIQTQCSFANRVANCLDWRR